MPIKWKSLQTSDRIALIALLITLPANIYLLWGWIVGSKVEVFTNNILGLHSLSKRPDSLLAATLVRTFINTGGSGYDEILQNEVVTLKVGPEIYNLPSLYYVNMIPNKKDWIIGSASPFTVAGGGTSKTHEVLYAPNTVVCKNGKCVNDNTRITWQEFDQVINKYKDEEVLIEYSATLSSGEAVETSCTIKSSDLVPRFKDNAHFWIEVPCLSKE